MNKLQITIGMNNDYGSNELAVSGYAAFMVVFDEEGRAIYAAKTDRMLKSGFVKALTIIKRQFGFEVDTEQAYQTAMEEVRARIAAAK